MRKPSKKTVHNSLSAEHTALDSLSSLVVMVAAIIYIANSLPLEPKATELAVSIMAFLQAFAHVPK
jgi:hypothetical protein